MSSKKRNFSHACELAVLEEWAVSSASHPVMAECSRQPLLLPCPCLAALAPLPSPNTMAKAGALLLLTVCSSAQAAAATPLPLYKTPGAPIEDRVADLVQRMSMEEKVNQLVLPFGAKFPADYQSFNKTGLGGTYPLSALPGQTWIETRNAWQKNAVENTRLGIPTSFIAETLHSGYAGGTNFPMPCLQGSTWNRPLVQQVAAVIGKEAAASGIDRGFSPVLHFCTE
jgi:hypothetical protein